jgi:hypothetical protein
MVPITTSHIFPCESGELKRCEKERKIVYMSLSSFASDGHNGEDVRRGSSKGRLISRDEVYCELKTFSAVCI